MYEQEKYELVKIKHFKTTDLTTQIIGIIFRDSKLPSV